MFRRSVDQPAKPITRLRKGWQSLCPADEMRWMLRREAARADRTGRPFCLVLFRVGARRSSITFRVARELLRLARLTDEVGWYSDDCLAALLPDTPAGGAKVFADRVIERASPRVDLPQPLLYVYPDLPAPAYLNGGGPSNGNGGHNGNALGGAGATRETPVAMLAHPMRAGLSAASVRELLVHPIPAWKRALDVSGALLGLVLALPLMAVAVVGIRLTSPGPVIFRQRRSGIGGRPFVIYKFRTMTTDAEQRKGELRPLSEQDGPAFKMENDPRLTPFGKFLRKTSIDELPQLINVLKGDMSLVGPRPLPCDEADACRPWHRRRLDVTPGLTCIWQVKGRSRVTFDEWVRMDVAYMRRRSLAHDLWLLLITIPAVLLRRGAR
jgi:lipopolysaccharide/colanic/teichoic acid biosynthesis glycosyltransferase